MANGKLSPAELKRVRDSNKAVAWIALAAIVFFVLFCGIFASQTRRLLDGSALTVSSHGPHHHGGHAAATYPINFAGSAAVEADELRVYHPDCGLNEMRPICRQPFPNEQCLQSGGMLYGMSVGDLSLYPGSYVSPAFFNTSGYASSCGECPRCCAGTCNEH